MKALKGKQKKFEALCLSFGDDPDIRTYLSGETKAESFLWGMSSTTHNGKYVDCYVCSPYYKGRWTEDKITFWTFEKMKAFCDYLQLPLTES